MLPSTLSSERIADGDGSTPHALAACEQHIRKMEALIERARAAGHPAEEAVALLDAMIELVNTFKACTEQSGRPPR